MARMPFNSAEDADEFCKQITQVGLQWGRPIWWYDWQQPFEKLKITGASCFVLRFKTGYIGVTAAHVVNELFRARRHTPSLACLIQLTHLNILNVIIDMNDNLDIATFRISEKQVQSSGVQALDVSTEWPPEIQIERQMPIQLVGFPEFLRKIDYGGGSVNCGGYQALALVEDYNDREIIVIYDPAESQGSPKLLPLGFNMSGCSGGPAVIHHIRNFVHRWYPVGLILRGPHGQGEGDSASYDTIRIRRIDCIDPDGHIRIPDTGWLPPQ
jgi:hypothetical protein